MEKIYWNKVGIFLLLAFCFYSCVNHKRVYEKFEQMYPVYNLDNFVNRKLFKYETDIDYTLTTADSSKIIFFVYFHKGNINMPKGSILFIDYQEKEIIGDTIFVSAFDKNKKLLYSYKHTENRYSPAKDAIFFKGRYYYYYKYYFAQLNDYQKKFYDEHKDSIINNHVNEIPQFEEVFGSSND